MKNIITIFTIILHTISIASATATPEVLIDNEAIKVITLDSIEFYMDASYNLNQQNLEFQTKETIEVIQIYDADEKIVFQLPVKSNKVSINKKLLDPGVSKLGFKMKGLSEIQFTQVKLK